MSLMQRAISIGLADNNTFIVRGDRNYGVFTEIPERKNGDRYGEWLCAATDTTAQILKDNFDTDQITFFDELAQATFQSILLRTQMSFRIREQTARYKEDKVLPEGISNLVFDERASDYQKLGAYNSHLSDGYGLFMEQGTGKTFATTSVIDNLPENARVLVVAPNNVRLNWVREIEKFSTRNTKAIVVRGTQLARISRLVECFKKVGQDASVAVLGYDSIAGMWEALQMVQWDLVVLDEAHLIRNPSTKRWRYVKRLREKANKRMVLTGTPMANSINDLYTQLEFMGEGYSGFTSFKAFKKFFGVYDKVEGAQYERFLGLQNVPIIKDRLSRYSFIITKKEALPNLPDKVFNIEEVEMHPEQQDAYDKLARDLTLEIESELNAAEGTPNQALVIGNVLTMLLKLAQITSGFLNIPAEIDCDGNVVHPKKTIQFSPNPKTERIIELLLEKQDMMPHRKTIIWACFQHDIEHVYRACEMNGMKAVKFYGLTSDRAREEAERAFNYDTDCRVFIGNPGAGGTGLNLIGYPPGQEDTYDTDCDQVIYYSQDWSSLKRSQSADRAHRRGTRTNVQITDLCVPGTIDEIIRARVFEKQMNALEITDVRQILKEILNRD